MPVSRWNAPAAACKRTMMKTSIIDETITLKIYHASLLTVNACVAHDHPGKRETIFADKKILEAAVTFSTSKAYS